MYIHVCTCLEQCVMGLNPTHARPLSFFHHCLMLYLDYTNIHVHAHVHLEREGEREGGRGREGGGGR